MDNNLGTRVIERTCSNLGTMLRVYDVKSIGCLST